jgi:4-amino-4-deoxy-L-arabinose transferase-like glycosyltransferase
MLSFVTIRRLLLGIVILSGCISLVYSFSYRITPVVDPQAYDQIAVNVLAGKGFKENAEIDYRFDSAIVRAGPAYEYFLAGVYGVFGHRYEVVWIIQAVLHAITALFVFLIAKRLFSERGEVIGLLAAVLVGFHPDLIEASAMLLTETLYLFLTTLAVWIFVLVLDFSQSRKLALVLGAVVALGILSRPPLFLFVPIILFFYLINKRLMPALLFCMALVAVLTPWTARNYIIFHQFIPTTLIGSYNIWAGNTLQSNGGQLSAGFNPVTTYGGLNGYDHLKQKAGEEFKNFIFQHPLDFIRLTAIRTIRFFSLIRPMGFWFYQHGVSQAIFVAFSGGAIALLFVTGFVGLACLSVTGDSRQRYLVVLALSSIALLLPTVVQSRYRFQIYPFLAIFGSYVVLERKKIFKEQRGLALGILVFLFGITVADAATFWPVILDHLKTLGL